MADSVNCRTSVPYTCIAFVHMGDTCQSSLDKICSSIVLDSCFQQVVNVTLTLIGQSAVNLPVNCSLLSDTVAVNNGCTMFSAKDAAKVACIQHHINSHSVSASIEDCTVQLAAPMKVFWLMMNAHLAGCVAKTVSHSSKFACSFINYAQYCARKQAFFRMHNVYFGDSVSVTDSCTDIPSPLDTPSCDTSNEENPPNIVLVQQCIVIVMKFPRRIWIDYQWYLQLIGFTYYILFNNVYN